MAYTTKTQGAVNESLAYNELMPALVAKSNFLQFQKGVAGQYAKGEKVTLATTTPTSLVDYTGADLSESLATTTESSITLNAAKAWSDTFNNIDLTKTPIAGVLQAHTNAMLAKASLAIDTAIATAAATTTTAGTTVAVTDALVEAYIEDNLTKLINNGVSEDTITGYVPSYIYYSIMRLQGRATETAEAAIEAGTVLRYAGARIALCTTLPAGVGVGSKLSIFAADFGVQYAIGHMESSIVDAGGRNFGYISKGLVNYGAGLINADAVVKTEVTKG